MIVNSILYCTESDCMYLKFWGTRGSISKPGPSTVRYGGNTSCVELRSQKGTLIVIDCGTGGHGLGIDIMEKNKGHLRGHMLISHTHWDHIQGIPFFSPFFVTDSEWDIYGPKNLNESIQGALAGQMLHNYFPVSINQLVATMRYHSLVEGSFYIDDIKITVHYLNHPVLTCGYRIEIDGLVLIYSCDHEPYTRILDTIPHEINGRDNQHIDFLSNADLVIHDAQYTLEEYKEKIGWGHSPIEYAVKVCQQAGVKRLALTHHDPLRSDEAIDKMLKVIHKQLKKEKSTLDVFAAHEGLEVELTAMSDTSLSISPRSLSSANANSNATLTGRPVYICVNDEKIACILAEAVQTKALSGKYVSNVDELKKQMLVNKPSLVLIEHRPPFINGLEVCHAIRKKQSSQDHNIPIVIIATKEDLIAGAEKGVTDWLITPFTSSYVRSKVHAMILRTSPCVTLPIVSKEEHRLVSLRRLMILDTEPEERFDRITRIAATLLHIPITFISFIDKDRQWFKSCFGLSLKEIPRESGFCASVIYNQAMMIIPDTLKNERFATHPLVINQPHIRFYIGIPLILHDGNYVGTLSCLDTQPHNFTEIELNLLHDLRDIVLAELYTQPRMPT